MGIKQSRDDMKKSDEFEMRSINSRSFELRARPVVLEMCSQGRENQ